MVGSPRALKGVTKSRKIFSTWKLFHLRFSSSAISLSTNRKGLAGCSVAFEVKDEFGKRIDIRPLHERAKIVNVWNKEYRALRHNEHGYTDIIKELPYFSIDNARVIYTKKGLNS